MASILVRIESAEEYAEFQRKVDVLSRRFPELAVLSSERVAPMQSSDRDFPITLQIDVLRSGLDDSELQRLYDDA